MRIKKIIQNNIDQQIIFFNNFPSFQNEYVNNGQLYSTTCVYINELSIPSKFDRCVYDLPAYFWKEKIKIQYFLQNRVFYVILQV